MLWQIIIILVLILMIMRSSQPSVIDKLVKQTAKYATLAQQSDAPLIAIMHANYAMAHLEFLTSIASHRQINRTTGIDVKVFVEHVMKVQEEITKKVVQKIPSLQGEIDLYLSSIAGNS